MELGSEVTKLLSTLESTHQLCVDGQTQVVLNTSELQAISAFITSIIMGLSNPSQRRFLTCMSESVLKSSEMIWIDKRNFYKINSLVLQLLRMLGLVLTSNDADFSSSWNCLVKDSFDKLWLPAKTDCVDLDLSCCSGNLPKTMSNSWFSTKVTSHRNRSSQKTFLPFYKSLLADGMASEPIILRTKKIRLQLTSLQKQRLEAWRHASRYSYNKTIWLMDTDPTLTKLELRNLVTPVEVNSRTPWLVETPKAVREAAVFEASKNRRACFTNLKNGNIRHFHSQFLSKRKHSWTIGGIDSVEKCGQRGFTMYKRYDFGRIKTSEELPHKFATCSIHFDGNHYYVLVPVEKSITRTFGRKPFVAGDPGVRCFNTFYDPCEELCVEVGGGAAEKVHGLLLRLDNMISKRSKANARDKRTLSKKINKLKKTISNRQSELHWKTASWLCKDYKQVVVPQFESKNMSSVTNRTIQTKTVRQMSVLAHSKFLQRLKAKAEETGTELVVVDEKYTTMTCGHCSERNGGVGSQKDWRCPNCNWHHHRDFNAARNILLKTIKLQDTA